MFVFCYTEKRLSQSLSKVDDLLESWCVNWCVCRHKLWICRYFGSYEYQGVIWMDVSQEVFQPTTLTHCTTTWTAEAADGAFFLKKEKCWQSFPASKPLSYAAKTNNCLQAQQWSIKSDKLFSCLEGLKYFLSQVVFWLASWQKPRTYKCLNEGEVWCLRWKTVSFLIYMSVVSLCGWYLTQSNTPHVTNNPVV